MNFLYKTIQELGLNHKKIVAEKSHQYN